MDYFYIKLILPVDRYTADRKRNKAANADAGTGQRWQSILQVNAEIFSLCCTNRKKKVLIYSQFPICIHDFKYLFFQNQNLLSVL